ncbi:MAG TPA: hypothetical protein VGO04_31090 [Ensifer sp.]|uniref:hypothetical protein n=1 Tax=Ensifer sp. TaxID=1872086 RepID=UPI002E0F69F9|nr:hypothetical protein [Ensifer sp.]
MTTQHRISATVASLSLCALLLSACGPAYDTDDPDYAYFAGLFDATRKADQVADMERLNGGDWQTACIFGGYVHPIEEMEKLGATIAEADRQRMQDAKDSGFRLYEVEEFEMMVAYIDRAKRAHFIHFKSGIGAQGQGHKSCVTRPETKITLFGP